MVFFPIMKYLENFNNVTVSYMQNDGGFMGFYKHLT